MVERDYQQRCRFAHFNDDISYDETTKPYIVTTSKKRAAERTSMDTVIACYQFLGDDQSQPEDATTPKGVDALGESTPLGNKGKSCGREQPTAEGGHISVACPSTVVSEGAKRLGAR